MDYFVTLQRQINAMIREFIQSLPSICIAILIIVITGFLARFAVAITNRFTARTRIREDLKELVITLVRLGIWVFGLLLAATVAVPGMTPASLFAGLGIGALAIGFAFQDIFQNFLAGVLIMIRDKMHIGDIIECEKIIGRVEKITLRETYVRQLTNELTLVPNSMLFKNPVQILTDAAIRRYSVVVNVPSECDLDQAMQAIREIAERVDKAKGVDVFADEFKLGTIDVLVRWWAGSRPREGRVIKDEIIRKAKRALADLDIQVAPNVN